MPSNERIRVNARTNRLVVIADPLPGREYIEGRDVPSKINPGGWAQVKRQADLPDLDENAKLWRVHGAFYDLTSYVDLHPGGQVFLQATRGMDVTEAFEAHHIRSVADSVLSRYKVPSPWPTIRMNPLRHQFIGPWREIKQRVRAYLEKIGNPTGQTPDKIGILHSWIVLQFLLAAYLAAKRRSNALAMLAGFLLISVWGVGHCHMHKSWFSLSRHHFFAASEETLTIIIFGGRNRSIWKIRIPSICH